MVARRGMTSAAMFERIHYLQEMLAAGAVLLYRGARPLLIELGDEIGVGVVGARRRNLLICDIDACGK